MLLDRNLDTVEADGPDTAAAAMDDHEIAAAAVFHAVGLLNWAPTAVSGNRVSLGNLSVEVTPDPNGKIAYRDIGRSFSIDGAEGAHDDGPSTMSGLLTVLQYARDRADTLLYLPAAMRADRLSNLAHRSGASERFVRSSLVHYRLVAEEIGH
jgi:hypothetical protein